MMEEGGDGSSPPRRKWIRPPLGLLESTETVNSLFDQIREGLDRRNNGQAARQRGGGSGGNGAGMGRSRRWFSDRLAPQRRAAAAASGNGQGGRGAAAAAASASGAGDADRPALFGSQLEHGAPPRAAAASNSNGSSIFRSFDAPAHLPQLRSSFKPMAFAPPRFTLGGDSKLQSNSSGGSSSSAHASRALRKMVTPPELRSSLTEAKSDAPCHQDSKPSASMQESAQDVHTGKRKSEDDPEASELYQSAYSYDYSVFPAPSIGGRRYSTEEVRGLVEFANKWIPDLKRRRVE